MDTLRIPAAPPTSLLSPEPVITAKPAPAPEDFPRPAVRRLRGLALVLAVAAVVVLLGLPAIVGVGLAMFMHSDAYQTSLAFVRNDSRAAAVLGEPIEAGLVPKGTIKTSGGFGSAEIVIDLKGPRASGSTKLTSHRDGARWIVDSAQLVVDGRTETLAP